MADLWLFESENIKYREMTLDDTEKVLSWRNSDEVRSHFFYQKIITKTEHENYYNSKIVPGKTKQFVMMDKCSGKEFGCVMLSNIDLDKNTAESGIFIGNADFYGKGYGTEAIKSVVEYGFTKYRFSRIDIRVRRSNICSYKAHRKAGFIENQEIMTLYEFDGNQNEVVFMSVYP